MRKTLIVLAAALLGGCASSKPDVATPPVPALPHGSSALAFDPPITTTEAPVEVSRNERGVAALVGFEEATTSYSDTFTYNRQGSGHSDYYSQEAVSERVGTTHR